MTIYDAVVIGAGNGGLTAAITLQRAGRKTLLLERHNIPGGCGTSFVRGDYEFEVALHQLSGLGTEERPFIMRKIFTDLDVMDRVEFVQETDLYRLVLPGQIDTTLPASWTGLKKKLQSDFPEETEAVERFLTLCQTVSMESFMALPQARKQNNEDLLKQTCPTFIKYGLRSTKDVLDEFFTSEDLKTIIAAYWCYIGVPPKDIPFMDMAIMLYSYAAFKPWHIKGGSQALSNALLQSFLDAGGHVRFNCGAEKITTHEDAVTGVVLATGEAVSCRAVISNASLPVTYNELLDHDTPPEAVQTDFKSRRMGTSACCIYMGLDCTPEDLGITAASNFIVQTRDEEAIHDRFGSFDAPLATMLTCYNYHDRSFAPEGKSIVTIAALQYGAVWNDIAPQDYAQSKYDFAEKMIDVVAQAFPTIRDHIEEAEVATPLTMMRYLNTPDGAIYGFKQTVHDGALCRDKISAISGLHMAGSWESMGGFQPTYMAGVSSAKAALKTLKTLDAATPLKEIA